MSVYLIGLYVGCIGESIRRIPAQRYIQRYLEVLATAQKSSGRKKKA